MTYHSTVEKIKNLLTENSIDYETFEHEPVRTSEEAAKIRPGYSLDQGAKALVVKSGGDFRMFVMPANLRMSSSKVKKNLGIKEVRFATPEEVSEITNGVQVGGIPPFGNLFNIPVIVDPKLFLNERIVFNAGDRSFSIGMSSKDYRKVVNFQEIDITE